MDWQPLRDAGLVVQLHAVSALLALGLGAVMLRRRKGGRAHRALGRVWILLAAFASLSALGINEIRLWGPFSPLHLFALGVPIVLAAAVVAIRQGRVGAHRWCMECGFTALCVAGAFALTPGRTLSVALFGPLEAGWLEAHGWTLPLVAGALLLAAGLWRPGTGGKA